MADIRCPNCNEPWEIDSLHDNEVGLSYGEAYKLFFSHGCGAVFLTNCDGAGGMAALYSRALGYI